MSEAPRTSTLARSCAALLVGAALLGTLEAGWLARLGRSPGVADLGVIGATMIVLLAAALIAVGAVLVLAGRRPGWRARLVLLALAAWPAWSTARDLFAGKWVAEQAWMPAGRLALALALSLAAPRVHAGWVGARRSDRRPAWALGALGLTGLLAWADNAILVGQYPAFHGVLALSTVLAALIAVDLALPARPPAWLARTGAGALLAALVSLPWWERSATADALVFYSHGLLPKARVVAVALQDAWRGSPGRQSVAPPPASPPGLAHELLAGFRLQATRDPAIEAVRSRSRNIVYVLLDAVRDDHVGPRADGPSLTPFLDGLIADGELLRFPVAYAPSDHTGRSVPCLATGLPLACVRALAAAGVAPRAWLAELDEHGWSTFANGSTYIEQKYAHLGLPPAMGAAERGESDPKSPTLVDDLLAWLDDHPDGPFAAYSHWSHAHVASGTEMVAAYRAGVRLCDAELQRLVEGLRARDRWDRTLLVVTADHGYALGEDRQYLGASGCGERSLRVPLLLRLPGWEGPPPSAAPVGNLALVPTIHDLLLPELPIALDPPSLLPGLLEPDAAPAVVSASTGDSHMLRRGHLKLTVRPGSRVAMLFDLADDPGEQRPLGDERRLDALSAAWDEVADRERRLARALIVAARPDVDADALQALTGDQPDVAAVAALFVDFEERDPATREYLLGELVRRDLPGLDGAAVRAGRGWDQVDDQRLVLGCRLGDVDAASACAAAVPTMDPGLLELLAGLLPTLDRPVVAALAPALLSELRRLGAADPAVLSADDRLLALAATALVPHVADAERAWLKDLLVARFNRWAAHPEVPYFVRPDGERFIRRSLLDPFVNHAEPGDVERFERLARTREFAQRAPLLVRALADDVARDWLLDDIRHWQGAGEAEPGDHLRAMIKVLRRLDDVAYLERIDAVIQERYPGHPRLP